MCVCVCMHVCSCVCVCVCVLCVEGLAGRQITELPQPPSSPPTHDSRPCVRLQWRDMALNKEDKVPVVKEPSQLEGGSRDCH